MEIEHLHHLVEEKKWALALEEFERVLSSKEHAKDRETKQALVGLFEKMDDSFREEKARKFYLCMWPLALQVGKVKLAKSYAGSAVDYLMEFKRIPALKKLFKDLAAAGISIPPEKFRQCELILGKQQNIDKEDSFFTEKHPELWKSSPEALKNYLLIGRHWDIDQWKLAYEFVLKFYFDRDIFLAIAEQIVEHKGEKYAKPILDFLAAKKIKVPLVKKPLPRDFSKEHSWQAGYDQLAMDVLSGEVEPNAREQRKILVGLKNLSDDELSLTGKDMIVAFEFLGMDSVVAYLCGRLLPLMKGGVKERASLSFVMAQSLYNSEEWHRAIDAVEDVLSAEPLLPGEALAFHYLKAESLLKLKKYKAAKELFLQIKAEAPHYRLVGERLKYIEEIK